LSSVYDPDVSRDPDVLTVDEAAEMLGVHVRTVYAELRAGRLPGRKVGRSWRLHRDGIATWLSSVEDPSVAEHDGDDGSEGAGPSND
jgi:excisionase family DNA binding protein